MQAIKDSSLVRDRTVDETVPSKETLLRKRAVELEEPIDYSLISVGPLSVVDLLNYTQAMNQIIELYMMGFSRADWREANNPTIVREKLAVQLKNERLALTLLKYSELIKGFFTSQILEREPALERVASSVIGYRQDSMNNQEYIDFVNKLRTAFEKVSRDEDSFTSDGFDARFLNLLPVMEDLVIDGRFSGFHNIVQIIHSNTGEILKYFNEKDNNPYAITWTNKENPIYKFLVALGHPHIKVTEVKRLVQDEDGVTREITLAVFAVNLKDLYEITKDPAYSRKILLKRGLINDFSGTVTALGKRIGNRGIKLQSVLADSIFKGIELFRFDLEP